MSELSHGELLLLNNLIYTKYVKDGRTVGDIIAAAEKDIAKGKFNANYEMTLQEWQDVFDQVKASEKLCSYTVTNYVSNPDTEMRAACFINDTSNPTDVNVIFRGTRGPYEWHDNGETIYMSDTPAQLAAKEYIENLPQEYGKSLTVSGHSKGGNKAQYVTVTTDRVESCVSFDGPGFSDLFIEKYGSQIKNNRSKMINISAEQDVVNALLKPIAGKRIFIKTDEQNPILSHKFNILLDGNGNLNPTVKEPGFVAQFVNAYSIYIDENLEEPEKSYTVDGLIALLEDGEAEESILQSILALMNTGGHLDDFFLDCLSGQDDDRLEIIKRILAINPIFLASQLGQKLYSAIYKKIAEYHGEKTNSKTAPKERIFLNIEGMHGEAQKMLELRAQYAEVMAKLKNLVISLREDHVWDTDATVVFIENYLNLNENFETFGRALEEYAQLMQDHSVSMEGLDNDLAAKISSISL